MSAMSLIEVKSAHCIQTSTTIGSVVSFQSGGTVEQTRTNFCQYKNCEFWMTTILYAFCLHFSVDDSKSLVMEDLRCSTYF